MATPVCPSVGGTSGPARDGSAPVHAGRIPSLDILRGLALLGMLVVHFHVRSIERGGIDELIRTAVWRLVESKSFGAFALLFGAGFALQLRRSAERQGGRFTAFSGYGIDLGTVRPVTGLAAACALFAVQAQLSACWLSRFRIGPAEWAWRVLALGRAGPLRRAAAIQPGTRSEPR